MNPKTQQKPAKQTPKNYQNPEQQSETVYPEQVPHPKPTNPFENDDKRGPMDLPETK